MSFTSTMDETYEDPAKFKFEIWSPNEVDILYTFDPFGNLATVPFNLQRVSVREPGHHNPGAFEIGIKSSPKYPFKIRDIPSGAIIKIWAGRTESELEKLIDGVIDIRRANVRRRFYSMDILYSGLGIGHINSHTLVSFRKQPAIVNEVLNNPAFRIPMLFDEAINSQEILPVSNLPSVAQRGNYDMTDFLPGEVNEFLGGVDYTGTFAGLVDIFAQSSGSVHVVDGNRKVKLRYPNSVHSGHTIKPFPGRELASLEDADWISFYMPPLSFGDTIAFDSGCIQALKLIISNQNVALTGTQEAGRNFLELANQDLMIQFKPQNTLLQDIAFVMSKVGTGHSDIEPALGIDSLLGFIVTDNNNNPSNQVISSFKIPYTSIPEAPSVVTDIHMTWIVGNLNLDAKHWIYLAHSGIDSDNTIKIHTDGDITTQSTDDVIRRIGFKNPPTNKVDLIGNNFNNNYNFSNNGPVPLFNFFANQEIALYIQNSEAEQAFTPNRPREVQVNAPFIKDIKTGYQYGRALLQFASKRKIILDDVAITLPKKWIHPLELVDLVIPEYDYPATNPLQCEVSSTLVEANIANLTKPYGFDTMKISVIGYEDPSYEETGNQGVCLDC